MFNSAIICITFWRRRTIKYRSTVQSSIMDRCSTLSSRSWTSRVRACLKDLEIHAAVNLGKLLAIRYETRCSVNYCIKFRELWSIDLFSAVASGPDIIDNARILSHGKAIAMESCNVNWVYDFVSVEYASSRLQPINALHTPVKSGTELL